jgi:hypothetical protein
MLVVIMGLADLVAAALLAANADYIGFGLLLWAVVFILAVKGMFSLLGLFSK